ncbi:glycosyltransferase family 4 protein [Serratia plymuthica]|uniref:glycosyltransferase family 4 protein n=1 Tax=Serratia plymuthica TaxID=82996 RepID=UPI0014197A38|nr:glycosyltransferase family 1 protein [Serratia plymuthica]NIC25147.1 glycosyltransferase family 4 protein [Serratia plymuthica]QPS89268.1 glycosyltransferase family 4 protein [Serratia plymuthica]
MIYVNSRFLTQGLTGVQRFAEQISLELKKIRTDVVFLSPGDILREDTASKLDVVQIGKRSGHYWEQVELPRYLKKCGGGILINLGNTGPISYKNQVVTHHDVTYKKFPQSYSRKFRTIYNIIVPLMLKNSRSLITVSEFSKKEISDVYHYDLNKINVIYNASSNVFKRNSGCSSQDASDKFFLAVSSPNFHKNFHGLVKAFSETEGLSGFSLKIIGEKSKNFNGIEFEKFVGEMSNQIEFLGRVSDDELANLYSKAYAFIFPSFYEGFGIPPLEAQACGCPVLSSNAASMPEVLSDSALFFDPNSQEEIKNAMKFIATNPDARLQLIEKGYQNIKRFSWHNSAKKLSLIIDDLQGSI